VGDLADADDRVGGHFARSEPHRRLAAFVQGLLAVHPGCPGELPWVRGSGRPGFDG
jgi:hypothetical protein